MRAATASCRPVSSSASQASSAPSSAAAASAESFCQSVAYFPESNRQLTPGPNAVANQGFDPMGLLGYVMRKLDYASAPLILGLVLGGPLERALRQSLMMSDGHVSILVSRPVSAVMLSLALLILLIPVFGKVNRWRLQAIEK